MSPLPHSQILRGKIRLVEPRLAAVARRFWTHPRVGELVPEFLFLVHSMIRASVPMLEAAAAAARRLPPGDPVAAPLADYFEKHAREELHHDEWLLADLAALGRSREELLARMPSPTVAAGVGAHYYWIHHVHPAAFLAYLAVLEGNPPEVDQLEDIRRRAGLPPEAFRTLVKHAHLDPHHRDDLDDTLDALALTPSLHALLGVAAFHTVERVADAMEEILDRFEG
ncbi:MAG TPA: iron-containing redox enzyme family protein [Thermoanaerobaculia bacterium]|nr:iron-containing redox enzyme family protein [Thermoanaerobaculia bacterium]